MLSEAFNFTAPDNTVHIVRVNNCSFIELFNYIVIAQSDDKVYYLYTGPKF